ncbi:MAG: outer membrane lipoprotein chaperone LolA [Pseudomonadota bacterium]
MRSCTWLWSLAVALLLSAGFPAAADEVLWSRLDAQAQAQGRFLQEVFDENGELLERSSGRYAVLKPGFFRWEIEYPDRQEIVVAQETLWHYDMDLATVTKRSLDADGAFTALDLLARDGSELAERFSVERLEDQSYRLVPRFPQAGFAAVVLSWKGEQIVAMEVTQRGGQRLALALTPEQNPGQLEPADFAFEIPDGVELQSDE